MKSILYSLVLGAHDEIKKQEKILTPIKWKHGELLHEFESFKRVTFRKYLKKAGITHENGDGKTMHGIRRMLGTEMTVAGIPVTTVSQVLGHKNMNSAKQYISLDIQRLKKCTLGFDSLGIS